MRRANGDGTVVKLTGNRRKPYACRKIIGWKEDGRPIIKYLSYHRTKREAEKALDEYKKDPYKICNATFKDIYEEWYAIQEKKRAPGTMQGYRTYWKKLEPLYDVKIQGIDRFVLQKFFDEATMTEDTMDRVRILIKMIIEYAVKRGVLPLSALDTHKGVNYEAKKATKTRSHSVISRDEIDMLWKRKDEDIVRMILVYIYTGARYEELYNLKPEDCHENYIDITHSKTPAGIRTIPLSDKVLSLLPIDSIPPHTTFWYAFKTVLPNHTPHDTRHTFITLMTEAGIDPRIIKAIVGHKASDVTEHYTHISLETKLEAVNKI